MDVGSLIAPMVMDMSEQGLKTVMQLRAFLGGTQEITFEPIAQEPGRYVHISRVLKRQHSRCVQGNRRLKNPDERVGDALSGLHEPLFAKPTDPPGAAGRSGLPGHPLRTTCHPLGGASRPPAPGALATR